MARYVTIPGDIEIWHFSKNERIRYSFQDYLLEHVWIDPRWRQDESSFLAKRRLKESFKGKRPGDIVDISTEDFEIFEPIAIFKGKQIAPQVEEDIEPFHAAVLLAPSSKKEIVGA